MAQRYTEEDKGRIIDQYNASGLSIAAFCKEHGNKPTSQSLTAWLGGSKKDSGSAASSAYDSKLYDEFKQALLPEDADKRYIRFLEGKVKELEEQLKRKDG